MIILRKVVPDDFNLFLLGDLHEGTIFQHAAGWSRAVDMFFRDYHGCKKNFFVFMGDAPEAITIDDPRYDPTSCEGTPRDQEDGAYEKLVDMAGADRQGIVLQGNHEITVRYFGNLSLSMVRRLGCQYGTFSCKVHFVDKKGRPLFRGFFQHGSKQINSTNPDPGVRNAWRKRILKRQLEESLFTDCVLKVTGHNHQLIVSEPDNGLYLNDDGNEITHGHRDDQGLVDYNAPVIPQDSCWHVSTGCFLKKYVPGRVGYAERRGYRPSELGFAVATIRNRRITGINAEVI